MILFKTKEMSSLPIRILPLGAGNDVGRSCILVTVNDKRILLDCGIHAGHSDSRRFPDFNLLGQQFTNCVDCLIISHFHLDHCGSLPYFTEVLGYSGPIYMSAPTKAICRILLNDCRKFFNDKKGNYNYTEAMIERCLSKVQVLDLNQVVQVDDKITIKSYYAGHVLGAVMTLIQVDNVKIVYTGDFNMTSDRHLGQAFIERLYPDVLITESTYGMYTRPPRATREQSFLKKVHTCVQQGGKVLIPTFAVGRAQELAVMLESYWDQHGLHVPIFFSGEIMEKANEYYKLFLHWTNMNLDSQNYKNPFTFNHTSKFDVKYVDSKDPCVVFATPGMLASGFSSRLFERWAHDPRNLLILPGYCVNGTIGWFLLNGERKVRHRNQEINVKMQVENLSYSAHSDARGIMELVQQSGALNVVLVHGSKANMEGLKKRIVKELRIPCYAPPTGVVVTINCELKIKANVSKSWMDKSSFNYSQSLKSYFEVGLDKKLVLPKVKQANTSGVLIEKTVNDTSTWSVCTDDEFIEKYGEMMKMDEVNLYHVYWIRVNPGSVMDTYKDEDFDLNKFYNHLFQELSARLNLQQIECKINIVGGNKRNISFPGQGICIVYPDLTHHEYYKLGIAFDSNCDFKQIKNLTNIIERSCF
eukprot:NODE_131_length_18300_cov_0.442668.p1 type:complete len:643 gc:universal NODE_131_length_18300_cov_0.442668:11058-12986(+)